MSISVEVFVTPQVDVNPLVVLPFTGGVKWSPITSTLIMGQKEAILVDTPITTGQNQDLASWVVSKLEHRTLQGVYITHGHADHFLGIKILQELFSGCQIFATAGTKEHMKEQLNPVVFSSTWGTYFPEGLPNVTIADIETVTVISEESISFEGSSIRIIELGHTDTHHSTALYVPDIDLVVCGDSVYGDVHCMLREANTTEKRQQWIEAVEKIKKLSPRIVVAGHKRSDGEDCAQFLDRTIEYIRDFQRGIDSGVKSSKELFDWMMEKHGTRLNAAALEVGCHAAFPSPTL